jgi:hypothetical protein
LFEKSPGYRERQYVYCADAALRVGMVSSAQIVQNFTGILYVFRKEVFRHMVRSMSLGNHVPCAPGIIDVAIFLF